jgi:hypothetical protein
LDFGQFSFYEGLRPIAASIKEGLKYIKVDKILKGVQHLIPSPSPTVKIQIMGGKICLSCKGKKLLGVVNKRLKTKCFTTSHLKCFALLPQ